MALATNGSATGLSNTTTTVTATLTTTATGIVVLAIQANNVAAGIQPAISSVSGAGLTWAQRGSTIQYTGGIFGAKNSFFVYWAFSSGALSSQTITVTMTGTTDDMTMVAVGVGGFTGTAWQTNPWDANASLPKQANATTTTAPTATGISTTTANGMLLALAGTANNGVDPMTPPTSFTLTASIGNGGGANGSATEFATQVVSATQSSITVTYGTSAQGWALQVDSLAMDAGGGGGGTVTASGGTMQLMGV